MKSPDPGYYGILEESRNHIRFDKDSPCAICETVTGWVEMSFQCHLCPGKCTDAMWQKYFEACMESDVKEWERQERKPSRMQETPWL